MNKLLVGEFVIWPTNLVGSLNGKNCTRRAREIECRLWVRNMKWNHRYRRRRSRWGFFDVLLTMHLRIILIINQLGSQNLVL